MKSIQHLEVGKTYYDPQWTSMKYYLVTFVGKRLAVVENQNGKEYIVYNPTALIPYVDENQQSLNLKDMKKLNLDKDKYNTFQEIYKDWCKYNSNVNDNFIKFLDENYKPDRVTDLTEEEIRILSTSDVNEE
jgi:hypothetical protein